MANHLKMANVHSILTLHERGWSQRRIAPALGIDCGTVPRDLRPARTASAPPESAWTSSPLVGGAIACGISRQKGRTAKPAGKTTPQTQPSRHVQPQRSEVYQRENWPPLKRPPLAAYQAPNDNALSRFSTEQVICLFVAQTSRMMPHASSLRSSNIS
jgi:hypothetical protein